MAVDVMRRNSSLWQVSWGEIEHNMLIHPTSKIGAWVLLFHPAFNSATDTAGLAQLRPRIFRLPCLFSGGGLGY